jgi:multiple sugar transport system ATP-binding protein
MVELRNIVKTFSGGDVAALRSVNLKIPKGTFATVLGPSGCGKSTLLRTIAGLEQPDAGEIIIGGNAVNDVQPSKRNIAMVFQNYALYPHMDVKENIAVGLRLQGFSKTAVAKKVNEVSAMLGIAELLGRYPGQLSGGQQQRVAIARALVKEPALFLLDEPLSNLDAQIREKTRGELKRLFASLGATVLYVTHDQVEAMSLGDMMIVMEGGDVRQVGSPKEVYQNPSDRFVAEFVGMHRTNMIEGAVNAGRFVSSDGSMVLPDVPRKAGRVWLGIRPEAITAGTEREGLQAEVVLVEHLGNSQLLHCRIGENELLAVVDTSFEAKEGETVVLAFPKEKRMWFDAATGERIGE